MLLKIALDMDEVVVDLLGNWVRIYKECAGIPPEKEVKIAEWDVAKSMNLLSKEDIYGMLDSPGIFYDSSPIRDAIESINILKSSGLFDIYFLTVAKNKTAGYEKIQWIKRYLGEELSKRVIAVSSGELKESLSESFDIIVDDNDKFLRPIMESSDLRPICVLFEREHNKHAIRGIDYDIKVDNWNSLLSFLYNSKGVTKFGTLQ